MLWDVEIKLLDLKIGRGGRPLLGHAFRGFQSMFLPGSDDELIRNRTQIGISLAAQLVLNDSQSQTKWVPKNPS